MINGKSFGYTRAVSKRAVGGRSEGGRRAVEAVSGNERGRRVSGVVRRVSEEADHSFLRRRRLLERYRARNDVGEPGEPGEECTDLLNSGKGTVSEFRRKDEFKVPCSFRHAYKADPGVFYFKTAGERPRC